MYGSQIWSSGKLRFDSLFKSSIQRRHLGFLRRVLHLGYGSTNRALLWELAQNPFQYYWLNDAIGFWNKSLSSTDNALLMRFVNADVRLAASGFS